MGIEASISSKAKYNRTDLRVKLGWRRATATEMQKVAKMKTRDTC